MAWKVKCINCVNLKDDWCEKVIDSPCPDLERDCRHFHQKTNGDRFRAMSDEELTDSWIRDNTICHRCAYREECECDDFVTDEKCREGIFAWLNEPYMEDD